MTSVSEIKSHNPPADILRAVGEALYGRQYKRHLARGLGVSRSTLHLWLAGSAPRRDLLVDLARLVDRERGRVAEIDVSLSQLRRVLADAIAKEIANASH